MLLTQDNVDIACQVIEKVAMDRAVVEIDESLAPAYDVRHSHLEVRLVISYHNGTV
jgi:CCR4-NOT transcription complex subunit 1